MSASDPQSPPTSPLTNRWMNSPVFLAQVGHALGGAFLVLLGAVFLGFDRWLWTLLAMLSAAGLKEFFYDPRFEIPKQTFRDDLLDWAFYAVGGAGGTLLAWTAHHLGRIG